MNEEIDIQNLLSQNGGVFREHMFNMHYAVSQGNGGIPPFQHERSLYNFELRRAFPIEGADFDQFTISCFEKFKQCKHCSGTASTSAHYRPAAWVEIALKAIQQALKDQEPSVVFPNGCCVKTDCPINVLYDVVFDEMLKSNQPLHRNYIVDSGSTCAGLTRMA